MDSDEMEFEEDEEYVEESSDNDDEFVDMGLEPEHSSNQDKQEAEEFPYEVLPADKIVQFMVDCIKDVNAVVQVSSLRRGLLILHNICVHYKVNFC